jgi:tetratricopeptide (TPR) repeat protein
MTLMFLMASVGVSAAAHADIGTVVAEAEMATLDGGKLQLLGQDSINVLLFFRSNQARSRAALHGLEPCMEEFAGKSVRTLGLVSGSETLASVKDLVQETGFRAAVLFDQGDALYGHLGLSMHPVVAVIGRDHKLAAFEAYQTVGFCAVLRSRIHLMLGEISATQMQLALAPERATEVSEVQIAGRYRAMASMFFKSKNYDKALENVSKSLTLDPKLASAHALRGQILAAQGRCEDAAVAIKEALALDPGQAQISQAELGCEVAN